MGMAKMRREGNFFYRGLPYGTDILYVYCDDCGSFGIRAFPCLAERLIIAALCVAAYFLAVSGQLVLLFFCLVAFLLTLGYSWTDHDYLCRKCGNTHILVNKSHHCPYTMPAFNTRGYPADMRVIDVPDRLTQKRYLEYWDDEWTDDVGDDWREYQTRDAR